MSYYENYHQAFQLFPSQHLCSAHRSNMVLRSMFVVARTAFALLLTVLTVLFSSFLSSCGWKQQPNNQTSTTTATATGATASSSASVTALNKRVVVNESTLILQLSRHVPERVVGSMSMEELIRSLYATQMRLDKRDTLVISDVQIVPLQTSNASNLYVALAVSQRLPSAGRSAAGFNAQKGYSTA